MLANERVRQEQILRDAVLAGDEAGWRTLYESAYADLWAYAVWRCAGLRDIAEEITQETWLVAVRRIGDFDPHRSRFLTWLRGIAAHILQNQLRSRWRRSKQMRDSDLGGESMRDTQERREQAEFIARALAELPERTEAVLRAKYLDLMSVKQIAEDWGQTPKAVESLLTRARQAFREAYEKLAANDVAIKEMEP